MGFNSGFKGLEKQSVSKTRQYRGFPVMRTEFILPLSNHNTTE